MSTKYLCDWCYDEFDDRAQVASVDVTIGAHNEAVHMCASCAPDHLKQHYPDYANVTVTDGGRADLGTVHAASVIEVDGDAVLAIKGTDGSAAVEVPPDMVQPLVDTVGELAYVYGDAPGDEEVLIGDGGLTCGRCGYHPDAEAQDHRSGGGWNRDISITDAGTHVAQYETLACPRCGDVVYEEELGRDYHDSDRDPRHGPAAGIGDRTTLVERDGGEE